MPENDTKREAICQRCGKTHEAEYSHEGRFNEGPIFAVVCTDDHLTDYYTEEGLLPLPQTWNADETIGEPDELDLADVEQTLIDFFLRIDEHSFDVVSAETFEDGNGVTVRLADGKQLTLTIQCKA